MPQLYTVREQIQDAFAQVPPLTSQTFSDITQAVRQIKQLIILGEPGAGKTTTLWRLAADYATLALSDSNAPLPVLMRLGTLDAAIGIVQQLQNELDLLPFWKLLHDRRLVLLIDSLNELPENQRDRKVAQLRDLVRYAHQHHMTIVVTCRELDYAGPLDLHVNQQVRIAPLDAIRIYQFCCNHLPEDGIDFFWQLTEADTAMLLWQKWKEAGGTWEQFWLAKNTRTYSTRGYISSELNAARLRVVNDKRSMMMLAQNPYMLWMMLEVYAAGGGELPQNRGRLFSQFTNILMQIREGFTDLQVERLNTALAELAFSMQRDRLGTTINRTVVLKYLTENDLYDAVSANILEGTTNIGFTHQLLQEYFSALRLDSMKDSTSATQFWPSDCWWEPQGWEETAVMLAGLYSNDCTKIVEWLHDAHPELAARCVIESGAYVPEMFVEKLPEYWLPRLCDLQRDPHPHARAALGRALATLHLDKRPGVALRADGLPDIQWCRVPAGTYTIGSNKKTFQPLAEQQYEIKHELWIAQYPITCCQFQAFLDADDGFERDEWFSKGEALSRQRQIAAQSSKYDNHPRDNVNWFQADAFSHWLTAKYHAAKLLPIDWQIRLPKEQEWEAAARFPDGRAFPWGEEYESGRANINESIRYIGPYLFESSTTVGIFPNGANSNNGLHDMSGNVWEWCLSKGSKAEHGNLAPVLRGGAWYYGLDHGSASSRYWYNPLFADAITGFRVVATNIKY